VTRVLVVGSGPAAAGTVLALQQRRDVDITVIDIGLNLEKERQRAVKTLAGSNPSDWEEELLERVAAQPVRTEQRGVPQKRRFGSDYPFRDIGQLAGLTSSPDTTTSLISAAYGGFSTVWGSQLMPFSRATFDSWPFAAERIRPHYEAVLRHVPFAGEDDDLARDFPLMGKPAPLPQLSCRSRWVLDAYDRHRGVLNRRGVTVGRARLALDAERCVRCGMCMVGCPYGLIYSAADTFDPLRRSGRIRHRSGFLVLRAAETTAGVQVVAKELRTGAIQVFEGDRLFLACGAVGTTRLLASSLGVSEVDVPMYESQQFVLPMLSLRSTPDPTTEPNFTLNQFNMVVAPSGGSSVDVAQLHFYTFNPAFVEALPPALRMEGAEAARVQLLRRLTVALGYLPSWRSPRLVARVRAGSGERGPDLHISRGPAPSGRNQMLRAVAGRLVHSARLLDLYPVLPMLRLAAGGKSYHWGGSFPHSSARSRSATPFTSDCLGRVGSWQRIHAVDASVFPNVPAMTFTLTIMANAHRIATESVDAGCREAA
jgi:ferredoxin